MPHKINYSKKEMPVKVDFDAWDDVQIQFTRKANTSKNFNQLQQAKEMTAKIVSNDLKSQSFIIQEKIKQRKLKNLAKRQIKGPEIKENDEDDFDYVDVDQMNATQQSITTSPNVDTTNNYNFTHLNPANDQLDKNYAKDATNGNFGGSVVAKAPKLLKFQSGDKLKGTDQLSGSLVQHLGHHQIDSPDMSKISNPNQSTYMTNNLNTSNPLTTPTKAVLAKNTKDQINSSCNSGTNIL